MKSSYPVEVGSLSHCLQGFLHPVVQNFFQQQYLCYFDRKLSNTNSKHTCFWSLEVTAGLENKLSPESNMKLLDRRLSSENN